MSQMKCLIFVAIGIFSLINQPHNVDAVIQNDDDTEYHFMFTRTDSFQGSDSSRGILLFCYININNLFTQNLFHFEYVFVR